MQVVLVIHIPVVDVEAVAVAQVALDMLLVHQHMVEMEQTMIIEQGQM
jgi:hypothetical protein